MRQEKNCGCRTITYQQWAEEGIKRFGPCIWHWIYTCPRCKESASGLDFKRIGLSANLAATHCIGIFHHTRGCSTVLNQMEDPVRYGTRVKMEDGRTLEVMNFATLEEEKLYQEKHHIL